jgi:hypothetical protein
MLVPGLCDQTAYIHGVASEPNGKENLFIADTDEVLRMGTVTPRQFHPLRGYTCTQMRGRKTRCQHGISFNKTDT